MPSGAAYRLDRFEDGARIDGVSGCYPCSVHGMAKGDTDSRRYRTAANEMLATRLGQALGLPVPPGALVEAPEEIDTDGFAWFVSLRLSPEGEYHPAVVAEDLHARHPDLAAGIFTFDTWIWNPDRHAKNLGWLPPNRPVMWDHATAFGGFERSPLSLPEADSPIPARHCLRHGLATAKHLKIWVDKIQDYSSGKLMDAAFDPILEAKLLTRREAKALSRWLAGRGVLLPGILRGMLPDLPDWGLV